MKDISGVCQPYSCHVLRLKLLILTLKDCNRYRIEWQQGNVYISYSISYSLNAGKITILRITSASFEHQNTWTLSYCNYAYHLHLLDFANLRDAKFMLANLFSTVVYLPSPRPANVISMRLSLCVCETKLLSQNQSCVYTRERDKTLELLRHHLQPLVFLKFCLSALCYLIFTPQLYKCKHCNYSLMQHITIYWSIIYGKWCI